MGCFFWFFLLSFFSFQSNAYPAASSYFDTVQKTYIGYYQRAADPAGLIYWAGRLDRSGGNLNEIIEAFANSAESQALYGAINSTSIGNVLEEIYQSLLGRPADAGGKDYYVAGFNAGRFTVATIMLNLIDGIGPSDVDRTTFDNKLTAANLFTRTIDPELDGLNFQVTYAGESDAIAARNFLAFNATSVKVPTQAETTAYLQTNIADSGDPILGQSSLNLISGKVTSGGAGLSGVTVTLSSSGSSTTTTDANGNYSFNAVANGNYTRAAAKNEYTISPTSKSVTVNNANIIGQNFTAALTALLGNNWMNNPSRAVCGSCHIGIDFSTGQGTTINGATTSHIRQSSDSSCATCHGVTSIQMIH